MAVKLSEKMAETKTVTVKWGDDDVDICYKPNAVTPRLLEEIDQAAAKDDMSALGVALEPVLEWWDVLDDKGRRIGTDAGTIATLPLSWIVAVQNGMEADQNPPESGTSAGG